MNARLAFALLVTLFASVSAGMMLPQPVYTPDGWYYGRALLELRHVPPPAAERILDDFYLQTPLGRSAAYRSLFIPAQRPASYRAVGSFFTLRRLYPVLAAPLYSRFGLLSLVLLSLCAYVVASTATYFTASFFAPPLVAAVATVAVMSLPMMRLLSRSTLTDMLAIALWTSILALMLHLPRRWRSAQLVVIGALEIALVFTRPLIFMPLIAAFGEMFSRDGTRARWQRRVFVLTLGVTIAFFIIGARTDSPGIVASIVWEYHRAIETGMAKASQPILIWYVNDCVRTLGVAVLHGLKDVLPLAAVLAAFPVARNRRGIAVLNGTLLAGLVVVVINPEPGQVDRTLLAPLAPTFAAYAAIALEEFALFLGARRRSAAPASRAARVAFAWLRSAREREAAGNRRPPAVDGASLANVDRDAMAPRNVL